MLPPSSVRIPFTICALHCAAAAPRSNCAKIITTANKQVPRGRRDAHQQIDLQARIALKRDSLEKCSLAAARLFRSSVARPKLLQDVSRSNEVACLEALRKSVEDRIEKFERFVSLGSISPESCEADASTQL